MTALPPTDLAAAECWEDIIASPASERSVSESPPVVHLPVIMRTVRMFVEVFTVNICGNIWNA